MTRRIPGRKWTNKLGKVVEGVADEAFNMSLGVALGSSSRKRKTEEPEEAVKSPMDRGDLRKR